MLVSLGAVAALSIVYQLKHFLADYPLQTGWMLRKFLPGRAFVHPLMAHAGVHGAITLAIALLWGAALPLALGLAALDLGVHFAMDRVKASPRMLGRHKLLGGAELAAATPAQRRGNTLFWWSLGVDQMVHHLTHLIIVVLLLTCV